MESRRPAVKSDAPERGTRTPRVARVAFVQHGDALVLESLGSRRHHPLAMSFPDFRF
jgi:hypothetical protein